VADYYVSDLIDQALDQSKDSSIPRSRVLSYMQRTQDAVLGRHRYKFSEDYLVETLSSDSTTYSYDDEHQQIIQVVLSHTDLGSPARPEYLSPAEFFESYPIPDTNPQGCPSHFTDYGHEIYWNCPLDKSYTLGLRYVVASSRLEDTDTSPDLPEEFKDIYIKGMLAGIEEYRGNFDVAALYKREIEDLEENMLGRYAQRMLQTGKARTIGRRVVRW
jgi:hypothetical protein